MNKLIIFILSLYLHTSGDHKTYIDTELIPYVDEFVIEGLNRDFNAITHLKKLDSIKFNENLPTLTLGEYTPSRETSDGGNVDISYYATLDYLILRHVMFHELAHSCGYLTHSCQSCYDIMSEHKPREFSYFKYADSLVWEKALDKLFEDIKENQNNN